MTVTDLTSLGDITADAIVTNLKDRYDESRIYTNLGANVVMKVNPFESVEEHQNDGPHIRNLAALARDQAMKTGKPQSCMMTGESGAGKTEATKVYLNELASTQNTLNGVLRQQLIDSCTLLESFGNCATPHNHNSSRFARWFELTLNRTSGKIVGGHVRQYLLEKSRVSKPPKGSSNFHVLYDICESSEHDPTSVEQPASYFNYLRNTIGKGRTDRFARMQKELHRLGASEDTVESIIRLLWCILHLGQLEFENDENYAEGCRIVDDSMHSLRCVAILLGLSDTSIVENLFCEKRIVSAKETIITKRNADQARDSRDALAKEMYSMLFKYVVSLINKSISNDVNPEDENMVAIGILDVFGFECFEHNSFEQLCINYCNEKLVQQFHSVLVRAELDVCVLEGVPMESIGLEGAYEKEQGRKQFVLGGIDKAFTMIQDATRFQHSTDVKLNKDLLKLNLGEHTKETRMANTTIFTITHYAGLVKYDVNGFLEKNKDEGPVDIKDILMNESTNTFIKTLFEMDPKPNMANQTKKMLTVGVQFRDEFSKLSDALERSEQQFVMCMKPNRSAEAKCFEPELIMRQLECNGTLAICKVRQSAFALHLPHEIFVQSYGLIAPDESYSASNLASHFVHGMDLFPSSDMFMGKTRILLRQNARQVLNDKMETYGKSAAVLQAIIRMYIVRMRFLKQRTSAIRAQALIRGVQARSLARGKQQEMRAATTIQSFARSVIARKSRKDVVHAIIVIQSFMRTIKPKQELYWLRRLPQIIKLQSLVRANVLADAIIARIAMKKRLWNFRRNRRATTIQSAWRCHTARKLLKQKRLAVMISEAAAAEDEMVLQNRAATTIQCFVRLKILRVVRMARLALKKRREMLRLKRRKQAAILIERFYRDYRQRQINKKAHKQKMLAAASAGIAAVVAAATAVATKQANNDISPSKPPQASNVVSPSMDTETDQFNAAILSRPSGPKGRRRPSKMGAVTMTAPQEGDDEEEVEPTGQRVQDIIQEQEDDVLESHDIEVHNDDDEDEEDYVYQDDDFEAKEEELLQTIPETNMDDELDAEEVDETKIPMKEENEDDLESETKPVQRKRRKSRMSFFFSKKSAAFKLLFGRTEESYYEEVAHQVAEYQFLSLPPKPASSGPSFFQRGRSVDTIQRQSKQELAQAIQKREFKSLSAALRHANETGYNGPEVEKAHAIAAHIRKTHIKQMEAEKVLAAKFMNQNQNPNQTA